MVILIGKISKTGRRHIRNNEKNQDVIMSAENERFSVIALADGVSTCERAGEGAYIACDAIVRLMQVRGDFFIEYDREKVTEMILAHIMHELKKAADAVDENVEKYSSTIAFAVLDREKGKVLHFNLGDSMIFKTGFGECSILSAPADSSYGCPVTTTRGAQEFVKIGVCDAKGTDSLVICSDGAWYTFFERNRIKKEVSDMLINCEYDDIEKFMDLQEVSDDYSLIALQMKRKRGEIVR